MKGQITLEFLISVLVMVTMLGVLISAQNKATSEIVKQTEDTQVKMKEEQVVSYCNLIYLNYESLHLNMSVDFEGVNISKIRCLSQVGYDENRLRIKEGEKKWF